MSYSDQNICVHCGMCCDGTLFNHAKIEKGERIETNYSFEIILDEKRSFKQPCPYLSNKTCVIYDERPYSICETFSCKLLSQVRGEKIVFSDAIKIIGDTMALRRKVVLQLQAHYPENTGNSLSCQMKEFKAHFSDKMSDVDFRKKFGQLLLDYFILKKKIAETFI
jgi:hypothetical protein